MRTILRTVSLLVTAGCAVVPRPAAPGSEPRGIALLRESADAAGDSSLPDLHDVSVHFDGRWSPLIGRIQPTLVDDRFRGSSEERYLLTSPVTAQLHHGPGGTKFVYRDFAAGVTRVSYNGKPSQDPDVLAAAALVADGYRMFLLGPAFFDERHAAVRCLWGETVEGRPCDDVLAVLRPGIGNSAEDRVIISLDCRTHRVRRFRMTVNGLSNVQGAVADIFCDDYIRFGGVAIPTRFYEELKNPFDISVHHWRLTAVDLSRGLTPAALEGSEFNGAARPQAGSAP